MNIKTRTLSLLIAGMLAAGILAAGPAHAQDERASLETLRQTTLNLIEALVESGVLPRDKANALIKKAEQDAAQKVAQKAPGTTVRVPYVPEFVKAEMREQIKRSREIIGNLIGEPPWLFAPPGGFINEHVREVALGFGVEVLRTMRWGYNQSPDRTGLETIPVNRYTDDA